MHRRKIRSARLPRLPFLGCFVKTILRDVIFTACTTRLRSCDYAETKYVLFLREYFVAGRRLSNLCLSSFSLFVCLLCVRFTEASVEELKMLLCSSLSATHYAALRSLFAFLHTFAKNSKVNKMTASNLSVCWATALFTCVPACCCVYLVW